MSLDNLKRLNVITEFESIVDRELLNEMYPVVTGSSRFSNGKYCIAVPKPAIMNQKEQDYIKQHFNMRKSFISGFFTLQQIKEGKRLGDLGSFAKNIAGHIERYISGEPEAMYFLVSRSRW